MPPGKLLTRRWFYFLPDRGSPVKIVHAIEPDALDHLPGRVRPFRSWQDLAAALRGTLAGRTVAMQYSPRNDVPYLSRVDAGTVELVRAAGARVASSGDLVQALEAVLTPAQAAQHRRTALELDRIVRDAFAFIGRRLRTGGRTSELEVQRRILSAFARRGLVTSGPPIVAANRHSASPHYVPTADRHAPIRRGDWVLVDLWAKPRGAEAVYADITWTAFAGADVPARHARIFDVVRAARDAAVALVKGSFGKREVFGWEVDRAARDVIEKAGYGRHFLHRTGHSIGVEDHGNGAHMDGLETRETRRLLPGALFSVEPGIYLKDFGCRSEINVFLAPDGPRVTTPAQDAVLPLLAPR